MRSTRIYTPQALRVDATIELEQQASHHLVKVLRAQTGDEFSLFNGKGGEYRACISKISKQTVAVELQNFADLDNESPLSIHLGICISKGDRMDFVMQKATELGISQITPLLAERSQTKRNKDVLTKKLRHWQQIIISACEQSGRNFVPTVNEVKTSMDWFEACESQVKLILDPFCDSNVKTSDLVNSVSLAIGPEGGFSDAEMLKARACDFAGLKLGPRILRTETAPIAAITLCQTKWGDIPSL
jgi:16S rRNA (uracil1498-N3)-methyltransferase